jgi:hypothetical protein
VALVGIGICCAVFSASVRADDESDRRRYREDIDRRLDGIQPAYYKVCEKKFECGQP